MAGKGIQIPFFSMLESQSLLRATILSIVVGCGIYVKDTI